MPLVDHLEELRQRVLRSLLAVVIAALTCLLGVKPLVRLLEAPASGIHFLQLAPGEFLFVSLKVAGYAGLTLALPYVLFQILAFVLPGLTIRERRLIAPAVAGSAVLFMAGDLRPSAGGATPSFVPPGDVGLSRATVVSDGP
jgi:sec-independent protein translocase protein TatC